jgi:hypothetical protein
MASPNPSLCQMPARKRSLLDAAIPAIKKRTRPPVAKEEFVPCMRSFLLALDNPEVSVGRIRVATRIRSFIVKCMLDWKLPDTVIKAYDIRLFASWNQPLAEPEPLMTSSLLDGTLALTIVSDVIGADKAKEKWQLPLSRLSQSCLRDMNAIASKGRHPETNPVLLRINNDKDGIDLEEALYLPGSVDIFVSYQARNIQRFVFPILSRHLQALHAAFLQHALLPKDSSTFLLLLFNILALYASLGGPGHQSSIHVSLWKHLHASWSVSGECFASPLNSGCLSRNLPFSSLFPMIDQHFGAHCGGIMGWMETWKEGGVFEANPPFVPAFILGFTQEVCHRLLEYNRKHPITVLLLFSDFEGIGKEVQRIAEPVLSWRCEGPPGSIWMDGHRHQNDNIHKADWPTAIFILENEIARQSNRIPYPRLQQLAQCMHCSKLQCIYSADDTAMQSISTNAPRGSAATAKHARAGGSEGKSKRKH